MRFSSARKYKLPILSTIKERNINEPIKMGEIASRYGISDRLVRDVIHELRLEGNPVCGDSKGYFWRKYRNEWDRTAQRLGSYVKRLQEVIDGGNSFYQEDKQESMF